jgi:predicted RNase H-like HicB family nuclease
MGAFEVSVTRPGEWWVLQAVEAPGAISQVETIAQAGEIKEAIAFVTGKTLDNIEIRLLPHVYVSDEVRS